LPLITIQQLSAVPCAAISAVVKVKTELPVLPELAELPLFFITLVFTDGAMTGYE
jgi:hypothetical protein